MVGFLNPYPKAQGFGDRMRGLLDPEVALPVAGALLGNQGNAANFGNALMGLGQGLGDRKKRNQTLEYLRQHAPEYAEMVEAGGAPIGEVWGAYMKARQAEPTKPTAAIQEYEYARNNGAFNGSFTDWQTKGIREQDPTFKREQDLRKEYGATPEYKRYDDVRAAYERVRSSASMDSGAGDIGTIFGYMKMLDPGSVVREGEFATAQNSSGIPDRIRNIYNAAMNGERLTPEQRAEFVRVSDALYENEARRIEGVNSRYSDIAGEYQLDPGRIVQQPGKYQPLALGQSRTSEDGRVTIKRIGD